MPIINGRGRVGIRKPSAAQVFSIVSGNLILNLDAGKTASYPGTGTTWTDLSGSGNNGTLSGSPAYSTAGGGVITFDGIDDVVNLGSKVAYSPSTPNNFSVDLWFKPTGNNYGTSLAFKGGLMNSYEWMIYVSHDGTKNSGPFTISFYKKGSNGTVEAPGAGGNILAIGNWYNYVAVLENNTVKQYVNGNLYTLATFSNSTMATSINTLYLGRGWSATANAQISSARLYSKSLSAAEVVQNFRSSVGRFYQVVSDADAQAFVAAAGLTSSAQANAVNTLVTSLKAAGVWAKMKAIYPFVGGSAASHKWNLKDPRDLDAAFRLTFTAGWIHSSNGILANGASDYARTYFTDSNLSLNSSSWSLYNRTNTIRATRHDFGYLRNNSNYVSNLLAINYTSLGTATRTNSFNRADYSAQSNYSGFYNGNRNNSSNFNLHYNGGKVATTNESTSGKQLSGYEFYLGCLYLDGAISQYSNNQYAFASIGDGLTDTESADLYTIVQAYQTALGRQV